MSGLRPGTTMYRIEQLERVTRELRAGLDGVLSRIRDLERLRPTCTRCRDATATRQTISGPACTECAGDLPEPAEYHPGPEGDDQGGMPEYRHGGIDAEPWS
jgi:hypothetical protein